ncbi:MAG: hypothetical protein WBV94_21675 [Blastocatellia bacterium]
MITDTSQVKSPEDCPGCGAPAWLQTIKVSHPGYGTWQVSVYHHQDFTEEELDDFLDALDSFYADLAVLRRALRATEPISTAAGNVTGSDFEVVIADPENLWSEVTPTAILSSSGVKTTIRGSEAALGSTDVAAFSAALVTAAES